MILKESEYGFRLPKITKLEHVDDLIARGKKKLDIEAVKLKTGLKTGDTIQMPPESAKLKDGFKKFGKYWKTNS